ncbi:MAG: hypothetical protein KF816_02910 [Melioribacteraceae bacterium]|nr:hypothetical protein [Melioribacteraceae bacterium]
MVKNYLIAVCDIMGFSQQVERFDLMSIVSNSIELLKKTIHHSIFKEDFPDKSPPVSEIKNQNKIGFAWFSDTILLYTLEDTDENCAKLIETVGWLLFENINNPNTRLRAAISYGEAYIDKTEDMYIGKAILSALKLEKDQDWSGCALTYDAEKRLPTYLKDGNGYTWLTYYDVPLKSCGKEKLLTVNWTYGSHIDFIINWTATREEPSEEECIKYPDIVRKWKNTKEYHDKACFWCKRKT